MQHQEELDEETLKVWINAISKMSHDEMARRYRFSRSGDPLFRSDLPLYDIFMKRFNDLGGMTPQISKKIGWD